MLWGCSGCTPASSPSCSPSWPSTSGSSTARPTSSRSRRRSGGPPSGSPWASSFAGFIYAGYENHWLGLGLTPDLMTLSPEVVEGVGTVYNDGASATVKYVTGYLVEKSLAVDNIFVIAMLFGFFAVPQIYQHRVLFWGILGALVMRGAMIAVGAQLIQRFTWIIYVFGAFLILTGIKMLFLKADETDPNRNVVVRLTRRLFPITERFHGQHFFVRAGSSASHAGARPRGGSGDGPRGRRGPAGRPPRHPALPRPGDGRVHRPHLRGRLDPGHLRDHRRPVPRLHEQRLRHPRPAQPVLRAGRDDRPVPLPEGRARRRPDGGRASR